MCALSPADHHCPACGRDNPLHSSIDGTPREPEHGDLAICWTCTAPAIFERSPLGVLRMRHLTPAEEIEVQSDRDVAVALRAMRTHTDPLAAVALRAMRTHTDPLAAVALRAMRTHTDPLAAVAAAAAELRPDPGAAQ